MFHIIGFILFLALAVILALVAILSKILGIMRGITRRAKDTFTSSSSETVSPTSSSSSRQKIFSSDEGEYVDYEEIPSNSEE